MGVQNGRGKDEAHIWNVICVTSILPTLAQTWSSPPPRTLNAMPVEVRFESGPFTSKSSDRIWLLPSVHEGDEGRQVVVRLTDRTSRLGSPPTIDDGIMWWWRTATWRPVAPLC